MSIRLDQPCEGVCSSAMSSPEIALEMIYILIQSCVFQYVGIFLKDCHVFGVVLEFDFEDQIKKRMLIMAWMALTEDECKNGMFEHKKYIVIKVDC